MADSLADLFVRLSADTSDFKQPLDDAGKQIEDFGGKATGLKSSLDEAQSGFAKFGEGVGEFIEHPLQSASHGIAGFLEALGPVGTIALAAGAGLVELGHKIAELVLEEGALAESTQNFADRLNLSFEETKKFSEMADVAGISISVLERASQRLAIAYEDSGGAGKKVAESLDKMGISADGTGQTLVKFLEHLASIPDYSTRVAEAAEVMGKRGALSIEPMLKNYASLQEAVEALGGSLSGEMVNALLAADDAADLLGIAWGHLKENLATAFLADGTLMAGLSALTTLLAFAPTLTLDQQLMKVNEQLIQLNTNTNSKGFLQLAGLFTEGAAPTPGQRGTDSEQTDLEGQKRDLEGRIAGASRSKELNDEIDKSNRAAQLAVQAAKAAMLEMQNAEIGFHNSVVELYNTFPATYEQYVGRLGEGGKAAQSMLGSIESNILKANSTMEGMSGAPLASMQAWVVSLEKMRDTAKQFADTDAFYKLALKIDALTEKFPVQVAELSAMDGALAGFFERMKAGADSVPDALNKVDTAALVARALEGQKQLDAQSEKTAENMTKAWLKYEEQVKKVANIQTPIDVPFERRFDQGPGQGPGSDQASVIALVNATTAARADLKLLGVEVDSLTDGLPKKLVPLTDLFLRIDQGATVSLANLQTAAAGALGPLQSLAKTNPAAALPIYDELIAKLKAAGAATGDVLALNGKWLQAEIARKTVSGESATAEVIALERVRLAQEALVFSSQGLGKMYVSLLHDGLQAWEGMGKAIADNIVDGKNWGDVFSGILKKLEKQILEDLIGTAFKALEVQLLKMTGLTEGLGGALGGGAGASGGGLFGGIGKLFGGGGKGAPPVNLPGEMPIGGDIDLGGATGGATKSGGGGMGSLGGALGIASLGVDVASGIATGIQLAHIESDVAKIEISTRQCKEQLVGGIQTALNTWLPKLDHLTDGWATLQKIVDVLQYGLINVNIASATGGMDTTGATATQQAENGQRNLETGGQTGYQGQVVEPISDEAATRFVANAAKVGRGFADLNTTLESTASRQMKPLGTLVARYDELTTAQAIEAGARATDLTPEQFKALAESQFAAHRDWYPKGTQASDIYQPSFTTHPAPTEPLALREETAERAALEDYRAGIISLTDYHKRVQVAVDTYQQAMLPAALAAEAQRLASDPMVSAFAASTKAHYDLVNSTLALQKQVDQAQQSLYLANSGTALYDLARQIGPDGAMQVAANNSRALGLQVNSQGSNVHLQGGLGPGQALPAFSDAQISQATGQYATQLQQMQATRAGQDQAAQMQVLQRAAEGQKLGLQALSPEAMQVLSEGLAINPNDTAFREYALQTFSDYGRSAAIGINTKAMPFTALDIQRWKEAAAYTNSQQYAIAKIRDQANSNISPFTGQRMQDQMYGAAPLDYNAMYQNYATNLQSQTVGGGAWSGAPLMGANAVQRQPVGVTVNAYDQSSRAMADGFILALKQGFNISVR